MPATFKWEDDIEHTSSLLKNNHGEVERNTDAHTITLCTYIYAIMYIPLTKTY